MPPLTLSRKLSAALGFAALALAGCSSPSLPSLPSWMGGSSAARDSNASAALPVNFECPSVEIRPGAGQLSVSANPAEPTAMNQRYQLAFAEMARECRLTGSDLTMKIGVRGRVVMGPAGGPGQVDVPLRLAVVREGIEPQTITTKFSSIPVQIGTGEPNVAFTHVEDNITFPMPRGSGIDSYVVYIGFDPVGAEELEKSKKKPPARKQARPPRRNTAQGPLQ